MIDLIGHLPPVSPFAALDSIWPDISRPFRISPTHVHSHQDKKTGFDELSRAAQGNCLADAVAEGRTQYSNISLPYITIPMERFLECVLSTRPEWLRMAAHPDGTQYVYHSLCSQAKLSRGLIAQAYWDNRALTTRSSYEWAKGHTRLAAAAGTAGKRGKTGAAGTVRLIHDKFWWGNRYNPKRGACKGCVSSLLFPFKDGHPLAALVPDELKPLAPGDLRWSEQVDHALILEGIEHWGSICVDFQVVKIRHESEKKARLLLDSRLKADRDSLQCATTVLLFMLTDPLRFQGRFGSASTLLITQVLNARASRPTDLYEALTECVHIFMEAGKDLYSLQTPGQMLARRHFKEAQVAARTAHAAADADIKIKKKSEKAERVRVAEGNRLAQERAGHFPDGQTSLHAYFQSRSGTPMVRGPATNGRGGDELRAANADPSAPTPVPTARVLPPRPLLPELVKARSCSSFLLDLESTDDATATGMMHITGADDQSSDSDSLIVLPADLRQHVAAFLARRRILFDIPPELANAIRAADLQQLAPRRRSEWEALVFDLVLMVGRGCVRRPQVAWYEDLVCGYSSPRSLGILSGYQRHQLADILQYALDRFARIEISNLQTFDITVRLDNPISDTGCPIGGGLGGVGICWSDVLFHLGFDHARWMGITTVVIDHYRGVFHDYGFSDSSTQIEAGLPATSVATPFGACCSSLGLDLPTAVPSVADSGDDQ